jgi:L,D-peptidoglycan transpeptidase YkuD (ErfK/YbiS/YcfS/YnhG family)
VAIFPLLGILALRGLGSSTALPAITSPPAAVAPPAIRALVGAPRATGVPHAAGRRANAGCQRNLADSLASTGGASQLVVVDAPTSSSTSASVTLWRRVARCFVAAGGPWAAEIGANGLSAQHLEGDGTTPIGAFGVGPVMYGIDADPGVAYPYHRLVCGDWWDEEPASPDYNRFVHVPCGETPFFAVHSEALWTEAPDYDELAVVEYNVDPVVEGRGSGIFLHLSTGIPTTGCIALEDAPLLTTLRWLRPADHPLVVIGAAAAIRAE